MATCGEYVPLQYIVTLFGLVFLVGGATFLIVYAVVGDYDYDEEAHCEYRGQDYSGRECSYKYKLFLAFGTLLAVLGLCASIFSIVWIVTSREACMCDDDCLDNTCKVGKVVNLSAKCSIMCPFVCI